MNGIFKNIAVTFSHAVDYAKEKITAITGTTSVTIAELGEHIINQPETTLISKDLLGIPFSFYHLQKEDVTYYLEMKSSQILQLDVQAHNHTIVSYRSYRDKSSLPTAIRFPKTLLSE
ncbi:MULTISPECIES: hypothetical protein [Peribacillus]|uniref:hypothetical protein n=1 Tax=Peribacillus TaxID=2675229 RepID=UPI002040EC51|nr:MULTISPECIES: hypothetical protein [Peribacillus]MCM3676758.1 hypothetical protein [Peribacillus simplex]MDQ0881810.1 hypothetical protein [Peribacillus sp. V2I11]